MLVDSWRWFGSQDPISLTDIRMTGVKHIVTALHDIPIGEVWSYDAIMKHKQKIQEEGFKWYVTESLSLHESIKYGGEERDGYIDKYITSMRHLSKAGVKVICYNFMPIVDWTRTDLMCTYEDGSYALKFDWIDFVIVDVYILQRKEGCSDYSNEIHELARKKYSTMTEEQKNTIKRNVIQGLPGGMVDTNSLEKLEQMLTIYKLITKDQMLQNLHYFLSKVIPVAEKIGIYFAIHPDDPPISLFGIPRIVSTKEDIVRILQTVDSPNNGLTLCVGSLASHPTNSVESIVELCGNRIHFLHMRNVIKDRVVTNSFVESNHLQGDVNMVTVFSYMMKEKRDFPLYYRADHGHLMLDDMYKTNINPGYSLIGRLRGIAELRGICAGLYGR